MVQIEGETASQFVSRLRAAADCCDFTVRCPSCRAPVSYSESLVTQKLVLSLSQREQQGKEDTDTVSLGSGSQEDIIGGNGESGQAHGEKDRDQEDAQDQEGAKEEVQDVEAQEVDHEIGQEVGLEEAQGGAEEVDEEDQEIVGAKYRSVFDKDLRILHIESVTPVPVRKRCRIRKLRGITSTEEKEEETTCIFPKCGKDFYDRAKLYDHYAQTHYKGRLNKA